MARKKVSSVFISYSHAAEEKVPIAAKLEAAFKKRGVGVLRRDTSETAYGESIKRFMDELRKGDFVVVVSSERYWHSDDCVNELKSIKEYGDFELRVLPVQLQDINLRDVEIQKALINYWNSKSHDAASEIPKNAARAQAHAKEISDSAKCIDECISKFSDWYALDPATHINSDFDALITTLLKRAELLQHKRAVLRFRRDVRDNFEKLLLAKPELGRRLEDEISPREGLHAAVDYLCGAATAEHAEEAVFSLNNVGLAYLEQMSEIRDVNSSELKGVAELLVSLLGWILLTQVNDQWISDNIDAFISGKSIEISLPLRTRTGVEILVARLNIKTPSLDFRKKEDHSISGNGVILESGYSSQCAAYEVKKSLWQMFWPTDEVPKVFEKGDRDKLNGQLRIERRMATRRSIYIAIHQQDGTTCLTKDVVEQLQVELEELKFVYYGIEGGQGKILLLPEYQVENLVETFLKSLRKYL
ncbi:MAG: hypothetical protein DIZ78_05040 [endosymbiont of Escarpia spicata]|uniref:TIR domain-containing protein n=1 Tax=endosymbiont of Escarpia spicata TaxID=2200908 RepID=A0A370DTW8_9GAMM|nr:MAG: hypothetical protein DIZ78_05040 [endosymbiont of Escarpia spicata]